MCVEVCVLALLYLQYAWTVSAVHILTAIVMQQSTSRSKCDVAIVDMGGCLCFIWRIVSEGYF